MTELFIAEEHVQVHDLWMERQLSGLSLSHVDFHCDMRGLLIDRPRGRAWRIDADDERMSRIDSGNFLAHSVMSGTVKAMRWIHAPIGGRRYDIGTCKYESDLTAIPHRLLHRLRPRREVDFAFEEITFDEWDGVREGEDFDIDWDGLAAVDYDLRQIQQHVAEILDREHPSRPERIYLIYSPGYSHDDRPLFDEFVERLARKFEAEIVRLPAYEGPPHHAEAQSLLQGIEKTVGLGLRRLGIY